MTIGLIEYLYTVIESILNRINLRVNENKSEIFVKQIHLLDSISGVSFISAVTVICEIGDFSNFKSPKQLFDYFGMDSEVSQSGKFNASKVHMSKCGSSIARRAIFAIALSTAY